MKTDNGLSVGIESQYLNITARHMYLYLNTHITRTTIPNYIGINYFPRPAARLCNTEARKSECKKTVLLLLL